VGRASGAVCFADDVSAASDEIKPLPLPTDTPSEALLAVGAGTAPGVVVVVAARNENMLGLEALAAASLAAWLSAMAWKHSVMAVRASVARWGSGRGSAGIRFSTFKGSLP